MTSYNLIKFMIGLDTSREITLTNRFDFIGKSYESYLRVMTNNDVTSRELFISDGVSGEIILNIELYSKVINDEIIFTRLAYKKFYEFNKNTDPFSYDYHSDKINLVFDDNLFDEVILAITLGRKYKDRWFVSNDNNLNLANYVIKTFKQKIGN